MIRVTPEITKQIIEFATDTTYAHYNEYHDKMIRDAKAMLEEVIEDRDFIRTLKNYLTFCENRQKPVDPSFILKHLPGDST
jgi:hypothetical protein